MSKAYAVRFGRIVTFDTIEEARRFALLRAAHNELWTIAVRDGNRLTRP
jgi:hypothetical protein